MEIEEIKHKLNIIETSLVSKCTGIECYLFGLIIKNPKLANDIDVLIIYETETNLNIVKQELKSLMTQHPLHLSYFTIYEETELNFIKQQMAEKIFSV